MAVTDGIRYATEFELSTLVLTSASGQQVDLREIMREVNIYEDLFSNCLTGSLFVNDSQDLINLLPIVGAEYLTLTLIKPSTNFKISKTFRVHKITDRRKNTPSAEDYVLHFCSEEMILNEALKISNSYKQMTVADIIYDVAYNFLKIPFTKFPITELTPTTGNFDIVVPFWSPFYAINWLSRMARTAQHPSCSFVFYEDSIGYHFNSIEAMTQQDPLQVINFMPMNLSGQTREKSEKSDTQMRLESAEDYELTSAPDIIDAFNSGQYASKLMTVNVINQEIKIHTQRGDDFFNRTKHTNDNPFLQDAKDRTLTVPTEHHDAYYRVSVDHLKVETWLLQRNAYFAGIHGYRIKVALPGNMYLRVGQMITLNLPSATIGRKEEKPIDDIFSGNYLITAIRHKLDRVKYVCILELSKDSLTTPLPSPMEGNGTMAKIRQS